LGIFNKKSHEIKLKEAIVWTLVWISLALMFNIIIYFSFGSDAALEFLTAYLLEKSLSADNLFVFLIIFSYFRVETRHQHKVLFWGIIGALIMRAIFIVLGITLINKFQWIIYIFGGFLILTGIKTLTNKERGIKVERNPIVKFARKFISITPQYERESFFIKRSGKIMATPLLIVLIVIETSDIVFAIDSIPAVLAITLNPFIVYTSNIFAILGLRALYFALSGFMRLFDYLYVGLSVILIFIGIKMMFIWVYKIPIIITLLFILFILIISIIVSIVKRESKKI